MPVNVSGRGWLIISAIFCVFLYFTILQTRSKVEKAKLKNLNLMTKSLPVGVKEAAKKVEIKEHTEFIGAVHIGVETFFQTAEPPPGVKKVDQVLLLLHGAAFTSQTWVDQVPTMATMAALGYSVIAVDLPGYGKTPKDKGDKGTYLSNLITTLTPKVKPVVVSPSMSGGFIIPLLQKEPESIAGWVPVAPVGTGTPGGEFFEKLKVPTMIVYGEKDTTLGKESRDNLVKIPNSSKPQVLPGARHPAYLDQPDLWHTLLHNFLEFLN